MLFIRFKFFINITIGYILLYLTNNIIAGIEDTIGN